MVDGFNLGTAYGAIAIDYSQVADGIKQAKSAIADGVQQIGSSLQSIGGNMTLLGAPFLAFGAVAVKAFTDSQDALAQLDAVLKSTTAHNGEWATSTAMSADDLQRLQGQLSDANDKLSEMQQIYDSNTKHTVAQTLALEDQKKKVAELTQAVANGNKTTTTQINVTHMSRDALIGLSKALQNTTTYSDEAVLGAESLLLTFTNIGQDVFPDVTKTVLDMSTALGQDLKSSAIQVGKALQDPITGLTALRRVGVNFTDAQKAMIEQLVKSGKTMDAQKLILKELQTEFGGSAVAAGKTFAGQLARVKNQLDDVMESIGEKLIPVVTDLVNHIVDLANWFSNLDPRVQDIIIGIGVFMASLAVLGPVIAAIGTAITAVGGILAGVGTVIGVILSPIGLLIAAGAALVFLFKDQIGGAFSVFFGYIEKGKGAFEALAAGIIALFGDNAVTQAISNFLVSVQDFFNHFQDRIKLYGSLFVLYLEYYITNPLGDLWNKVQPALQSLANWFLVDALPAIQRFLLDVYNNVLIPVFNFIGSVWDLVKVGLGLLHDWFSAKGGGLDQMGSSFTQFKLTVIDPVVKALQMIWTNVQPALNDLKNGITPIFDFINTHVIKPVADAIAGIIADIQYLATVTSNGTVTLNPNLSVPTGVHGPNSLPSGVQPIPPVGGGSGAAPTGSVGNMGQFNGATINIHANGQQQGAAAAQGFTTEMENYWRGRGN